MANTALHENHFRSSGGISHSAPRARMANTAATAKMVFMKGQAAPYFNRSHGYILRTSTAVFDDTCVLFET